MITWGAYSGTLIFLPHGIRILAAMVGWWKALPGLYLGHVVSGYFFTDSWIVYVLDMGFISIVAVYLPYYLLKIKEINLKNILILSAVSSLLNSQLHTIYFYYNHINQNFYLVFFYLIGDIVGSVFCFYLLRYLSKTLPEFIKST